MRICYLILANVFQFPVYMHYDLVTLYIKNITPPIKVTLGSGTHDTHLLTGC